MDDEIKDREWNDKQEEPQHEPTWLLLLKLAGATVLVYLGVKLLLF